MRDTRATIGVLAIAVVLASCARDHSVLAPSENRTPDTCASWARGRSGAPALTKDDQVRLVVFKQLLAEYESLYEKRDPSRLNAFYLSVRRGWTSLEGAIDGTSKVSTDNRDPSPALMAAIGTRRYPVKKVSECIQHLKQGDVIKWRCFDKVTQKPGFILWVGKIKWIDAETAELEAGHWEHCLAGSGAGLRVRRMRDHWEIEFTGLIWRY
ncbi:MAG TPA: hypothetical protein VNA25_15805 [Phycisphaerae bacterium]|nr:hypothetical protein [Phycisphaerae bacterium]